MKTLWTGLIAACLMIPAAARADRADRLEKRGERMERQGERREKRGEKAEEKAEAKKEKAERKKIARFVIRGFGIIII